MRMRKGVMLLICWFSFTSVSKHGATEARSQQKHSRTVEMQAKQEREKCTLTSVF